MRKGGVGYLLRLERNAAGGAAADHQISTFRRDDDGGSRSLRGAKEGRPQASWVISYSWGQPRGQNGSVRFVYSYIVVATSAQLGCEHVRHPEIESSKIRNQTVLIDGLLLSVMAATATDMEYCLSQPLEPDCSGVAAPAYTAGPTPAQGRSILASSRPRVEHSREKRDVG